MNQSPRFSCINISSYHFSLYTISTCKKRNGTSIKKYKQVPKSEPNMRLFRFLGKTSCLSLVNGTLLKCEKNLADKFFYEKSFPSLSLKLHSSLFEHGKGVVSVAISLNICILLI